MKKPRKALKKRNPIAKAVRKLRPKAVGSKKAYSRKAPPHEDEELS